MGTKQIIQLLVCKPLNKVVLHMIINTTAIKMELTLAFVAFVLLIRVPKTRQNLIGVHFENGNSVSKELTTCHSKTGWQTMQRNKSFEDSLKQVLEFTLDRGGILQVLK